MNQKDHREVNLRGHPSDSFFESFGLRILQAIRRIIRAVDIHSRKLYNEFQITVPQLICLYCLANEESMTLSDLAKRVDLGDSTVNGIVNRLEKKGWVTRQRSKDDRRKVYVEINNSGKELAHEAPLLLQDRLSDALRNLPELEQAAIALSLERMVELMEVEHLDVSHNLLLNTPLNENHEGNAK